MDDVEQNVQNNAAENRTYVGYKNMEVDDADNSRSTDSNPGSTRVGTVEEVLPEKRRLKIMISIFGRGTSVELDVLQVGPAEEGN